MGLAPSGPLGYTVRHFTKLGGTKPCPEQVIVELLAVFTAPAREFRAYAGIFGRPGSKVKIRFSTRIFLGIWNLF